MSGSWFLENVSVSGSFLVVEIALQATGIATGQHHVDLLRFVKYHSNSLFIMEVPYAAFAQGVAIITTPIRIKLSGLGLWRVKCQ